MQEGSQSNDYNTVFDLRNLLQLEQGYNEDIWNLIAGKIQHEKYNFRGLLRFPLFEQIRLVENFVNEAKSAYRNSEHYYDMFLENYRGLDPPPTFYEYVRDVLSKRPSEKKTKQRLNPVPDNTASCQPA